MGSFSNDSVTQPSVYRATGRESHEKPHAPIYQCLTPCSTKPVFIFRQLLVYKGSVFSRFNEAL